MSNSKTELINEVVRVINEDSPYNTKVDGQYIEIASSKYERSIHLLEYPQTTLELDVIVESLIDAHYEYIYKSLPNK